MAASELTATDHAAGGIDMSGAAANVDGNYYTNTGKEILHVTNADASPINVTIVSQATVDGLAVADRVVAVGAGATKALGPYSKATYNDGDGRVQVTYSAVTDVTVKLTKAP